MSELREHHDCGSIRPHEPHSHGYLLAHFYCKGVPEGTEYAVYVGRITKQFSRLRDEVAPALRRDFGGLIVEVDERVIYTQIPDQEWPGGSMLVMGLDYRLADALTQALARELGLWDDRSYPEFRRLTEAESARVNEHRQSLTKA